MIENLPFTGAKQSAIENRRLIERRKTIRRNEQAREIKTRLIRKLGGKCVWPGCGTSLDLTFDHPNGRIYPIEHLSMLQKMRRYEQDERMGNLRLLCRTHNSRHGLMRTLDGVRARYKKCECDYCKKKSKKGRSFWKTFHHK